MGDALFQQKFSDTITRTSQPDILVLDEAHTMLKNPKTQTFQKLQMIKTKRKILLTGTPIQNNLTEYFHLMEFARPGILGCKTIAAFEKQYRYVCGCGCLAKFTIL